MIYFVQHQSTALIKIGMTTHITDRLRNLTYVYGQVNLLGLIAGYYDTERILHRKFKADSTPFPLPVDNTNGGTTEWFNPSADLLAFIGKKTKLVLPIDLFTDMQSYGNIAYHPDGKKPMFQSERTDMIVILQTPSPFGAAHLEYPSLQDIAEGKAA